MSITIRNTKPESSSQIIIFLIFLCTFTWNSIVDCTPFSICSKKHCFSLSGSSNVSSVPKTTEMRTKIKEHVARRRSMLFVESVHLSGIFSALYSLNATCVYLLIPPVDSKMAKTTWHSSEHKRVPLGATGACYIDHRNIHEHLESGLWYLHVFDYLYLFIYLFIHLFIHLFICLSIYVYLFIFYLFIQFFFHLYMYMMYF